MKNCCGPGSTTGIVATAAERSPRLLTDRQVRSPVRIAPAVVLAGTGAAAVAPVVLGAVVVLLGLVAFLTALVDLVLDLVGQVVDAFGKVVAHVTDVLLEVVVDPVVVGIVAAGDASGGQQADEGEGGEAAGTVSGA